MLKLLEKSEINARKNQDRIKEQAEGLKLARRVDSLREIQAQEELSLKLFREQTVKQIYADIEKESKPLEELRKEVKRLEKEREEALKPLTAELVELDKSRKEIAQGHQELDARKVQINKSERTVAEVLKETVDESSRIKEEKNRSQELLQDADVKHFQAEKTLKEAENTKLKVGVFKRQVEEELAQREAIIASKERQLEIKAESINKLEKDLIKREIKLKDRNEMLERTIKRYKK